MSEPLRTASANGPVTEADREALIEQLLLAGLDHYFEGSYDEAINVWTRVAFLERGHGRARAYIERARGAMAERQRQGEELLHRGVDAYRSGEVATARELLTRAVAEGGGNNDTALLFLQRLGRLDPAEPGTSATEVSAASGMMRRAVRRRGWSVGATAQRQSPNWFATIGVSVVITGSVLLLAQPIASRLGELPISAPAAESRRDEPLPIVRASETRLARARDLYQNGRLRDALRLLEEVELADPLRPEADRLRGNIQRDLLATTATDAVRNGVPR